VDFARPNTDFEVGLRAKKKEEEHTWPSLM